MTPTPASVIYPELPDPLTSGDLQRKRPVRGRFVFDDRKGGFDSSTGVGVAIGDR